MSVSTGWRTGVCSGLGVLLLAGCAQGPKPEAKPDTAAALTPANTTPVERQHYLLELLAAGKRDQARVEAQKLLQEQPTNSEATTLLNEIDADPQVLLGAPNVSYTIQPGETLSTLADRFLGDSNLFYALARYNNIDVPNDAAPGQAILIPTTKRERSDHAAHADHPEHVEHKEAPPVLRRREEPAPEAKKPPPAPPPRAPEPQPQPSPPVAPSAPTHDPARANALRSQALVEMNKGAINRAVSLLTEASHLDPDSGPISADLARALRIQGATKK